MMVHISLKLIVIKVPTRKEFVCWITNYLKHNEHIDKMLIEPHTGGHKLFPVMNKNNGISQDKKVKTYLTKLELVLTYIETF